jgi:DNA-directed RNA polymerase subunit RPC12/RpoP
MKFLKPPVFFYKCTDCQTANMTQAAPADNMLNCRKCGFSTVQHFHKVSMYPVRAATDSDSTKEKQ